MIKKSYMLPKNNKMDRKASHIFQIILIAFLFLLLFVMGVMSGFWGNTFLLLSVITLFNLIGKSPYHFSERLVAILVLIISYAAIEFILGINENVLGDILFKTFYLLLGKTITFIFFVLDFLFALYFLLPIDINIAFWGEVIMIFKRLKAPKNNLAEKLKPYQEEKKNAYPLLTQSQYVPDAIYVSDIEQLDKESNNNDIDNSNIDSNINDRDLLLKHDETNIIHISQKDRISYDDSIKAIKNIAIEEKITDKIREAVLIESLDNKREADIITVRQEDIKEIDDSNDIDNDNHNEFSVEESSEEDNIALSSENDMQWVDINSNYINILPPMSFLPHGKEETSFSTEEIKRTSAILEKTFQNFGIDAKTIGYMRGPVVTLYKMKLAPGIKVSKVVNLTDDLALALAAYRVRVIAPIPGEAAIGVEVPNKRRQTVYLGDVIDNKSYLSKQGNLKIAFGKDIAGKVVTEDLTKMPHLLIAGATNSGKSVCVNSIITTIIYNYYPNEVKFILIDPKIVELQIYNDIPHLLTPVITEVEAAKKALQWAIQEMDQRYYLLSSVNARDLKSYNTKIKNNSLYNHLKPLYNIVIVIDEFADLMLTAGKEVELYVTRLAQKARAVGIHLIIATQRPSVDIITGVIKANFPARIAFQVASKIDSRTILDQNGAENLLGMGDMLYLSPTAFGLKRIQGSFISENDIIKIVDFLKMYNKPNYIELKVEEQEDNKDDIDDYESDPMFNKALDIIRETRKASASYLQRQLKIGYNRAARIIEQMEEAGYVGPANGPKPREVLI